LHWEGDELAFTSYSNESGTGTQTPGGIDEIFIGDFAVYSPSTSPANPSTVTAIERDESGQDLANTGGAFVTGCLTACDPIPVAQSRTDGYTISMSTFQGVRVYDPSSSQWTTPDAYAGDVHDPMSQQKYVWNGNDPLVYSDPSGYMVLREAMFGGNAQAFADAVGGSGGEEGLVSDGDYIQNGI